jgi:hypothetical protein|tara:strand:- start:536 stop:1153 length:618 start_codon:yes stop_codon:yes gene_type:complete
MLTKLKWIFGLFLFVTVFGVLHYNLPQRDIVRITGTEVLRKDFSGWTRIFYAKVDTGDTDSFNRDLRLINSVRSNGQVHVYRNEDTGLGWPPYFKLDSSNLQAESEDAVSNRDKPVWFILRHYGWRNTFLSIYPNAISIKPISGPDVRLVPWFNIIFLTALAALFWATYVRIRGFWNRRVNPVIENIDAAADETTSRIGEWFRRK